MGLSSIFDIAGSGLTAETARLTTSAGNMSNANVESGDEENVFKAKYPIFKAVQENANQWMGNQAKPGVQVKGTYESNADPIKRYDPNNPIADENGMVYAPNVNHVQEMANVISAARSYQMDIELVSTTKQLMQRTLHLGE